MAGAGQPRAHEAVGRVERLLGPGDRLAELPVAAALDVAGGLDAVAERRAAGRDVLEEAPRDHVVGVALRGARELRALAGRPGRPRAARSASMAQSSAARRSGGERAVTRSPPCGHAAAEAALARRRGRGAPLRRAPRPRASLPPMRARLPPAAGRPAVRCGGRSRVAVFRRRRRDRRIAPGGRPAVGGPRRARSYAQVSCRKPPPTTASTPCSRASTSPSARPSRTARGRCSSSPAPARARRACSRTASPGSCRPGARARASCWRSPSPTRPRRRCASASSCCSATPRAAMWVMTFHAACARLLRAEAPRLGYTRQYTIYDAADSRRLVKRCIDELGVDPKRFTPARDAAPDLRRQEQAARRRGLPPAGRLASSSRRSPTSTTSTSATCTA